MARGDAPVKDNVRGRQRPTSAHQSFASQCPARRDSPFSCYLPSDICRRRRQLPAHRRLVEEIVTAGAGTGLPAKWTAGWTASIVPPTAPQLSPSRGGLPTSVRGVSRRKATRLPPPRLPGAARPPRGVPPHALGNCVGGPPRGRGGPHSALAHEEGPATARPEGIHSVGLPSLHEVRPPKEELDGRPQS